MSVLFAITDHLKRRLDPTDGDNICNVMKLPLTKRRYKHDAIKDEVSNIEFLKDGTVFLEYARLWLLNQDLTLSELAELERRITQQDSMTTVDMILRNMGHDDTHHILEGIRIVCDMATLVIYHDTVDEYPVKTAIEDVRVKLYRTDFGHVPTRADLIEHGHTVWAVSV